MGRMLRLKSFDELPASCRERVREMFAKSVTKVRSSAPSAELTPRQEKVNWSFELYQQLVASGHTAPIREYHFDQQATDGRGWKFDLAWPDLRLAVEVDGAVHRIKGRFKADIPRSQAAFLAGWHVFRVSPEQVRTGEALELVGRALRLHEKAPEAPVGAA